MSSKELRVAVVGAGRWAERAHIPGWQRDSRVEVAAVADSDAEVAAKVASDFGVTRVVTDYRELLDDPAIDVIDVARAPRHLVASLLARDGGAYERLSHLPGTLARRFAAEAEAAGRPATGRGPGRDVTRRPPALRAEPCSRP